MEIESQIEQTLEGWWVRKGDRLADRVKNAKCLEEDRGFLNLICKYIAPGSVVVDVGANIGDHTFSYLKAVGNHGTVIAYEPHPVTYECLTRNCSQAIAFPYALGAVVESGFLYLQGGDDDGSSYLSSDPGDFQIKISTIDEDIPTIMNGRELSVIKVDAEGCEPEVLVGAENTIKYHHPTLVLEVNNDALRRRGHSYRDIKDFLEKHNYRVFFLQESNWIKDRSDIICS